MSKFSKMLKKAIGEKNYNFVAKPIKKIVSHEAISVKGPISDPTAWKTSICKVPLN
ncbi:hypothetical protein pb186bvf_008532 [Paramecium bursaria]